MLRMRLFDCSGNLLPLKPTFQRVSLPLRTTTLESSCVLIASRTNSVASLDSKCSLTRSRLDKFLRATQHGSCTRSISVCSVMAKQTTDTASFSHDKASSSDVTTTDDINVHRSSCHLAELSYKRLRRFTAKKTDGVRIAALTLSQPSAKLKRAQEHSSCNASASSWSTTRIEMKVIAPLLANHALSTVANAATFAMKARASVQRPISPRFFLAHMYANCTSSSRSVAEYEESGSVTTKRLLIAPKRASTRSVAEDK
mmetsp:Transcript_29805/g.62266  ORF Transcript_29805/g.62266 Transcript_29805/m.62266 type:complete len:257 (+) Transcript_29805:1684-2454(+)